MLDEFWKILGFLLTALSKAWPYLVVSIPLAVIVRLSGASVRLKDAIGKRPILGIVTATLLGAVSPLCSCTVIPVIFSLLTAGVPLGPVMAFWIASPSMDPEIFFLSAATLGWELAWWRLAATFILSLGGGLLAHLAFSRGWLGSAILKERPRLSQMKLVTLFKEVWKKMTARPEPLPATGPAPAFAGNVLLRNTVRRAPEPVTEPLPKLSWKTFWKESLDALLFVGQFLVIAYLLEALIVLYLPSEWVMAVLGGNGWLPVLNATALGIPLYTTNLAALGVLGGFLEKGMSAAAVLAFLIAGPTTTLPAMSAVFGITKRPVFLLYLGIAIVGALVFGTLFFFLG